jgi:multidrug resistance efflux pump
MRTAVRILVTLCVVILAVFAGFQLWQYYMLTPGPGMPGCAPMWW